MDAEHYRLRDFLTRSAQPYEWHEAGSADADQLLDKLGLEAAALPVLIDGEQSLQAATVESVMTAWGGNQPAKRKHYDFVVIGAGPAGLAAAVYAASDGLSTLVNPVTRFASPIEATSLTAPSPAELSAAADL